MLVAAHIIEVVLLFAGPLLVARALGHRWKLPLGIFGVGLLTFAFAQVAQMALGRAMREGFDAGLLPMPSVESAPIVSAVLAGVVAALADEPLRLWGFRRYIGERTGRRTGVLAGLGHGGAQAMLGGALVLLMAGIAIVFQGRTFDEMQQMGLEGRSAIRLGVKVFAWWEESPLSVLGAVGREVAVLLMHVGLSVAVACSVKSGRRFFIVAMVVHAFTASAIALVNDRLPSVTITAATYVGAALLGLCCGAWAAWVHGPDAEGLPDESSDDSSSM